MIKYIDSYFLNFFWLFKIIEKLLSNSSGPIFMYFIYVYPASILLLQIRIPMNDFTYDGKGHLNAKFMVDLLTYDVDGHVSK